MVGAGVCGAFVDKTKRFEEVVKTCYVVGLFGGIIFTEVLQSASMSHKLVASHVLSISHGLPLPRPLWTKS